MGWWMRCGVPIRNEQTLKQLKIAVRACYGAYFVAHLLNIWRQILFSEDLHDDLL